MNPFLPSNSTLFAIAAALALSGCEKPAGSGGAPLQKIALVYPVTVAPVAARSLSYLIETTGSLEAFEIVTVPARVEGSIEKLDFDVGQEVSPQTVLAVIDGARYALEEERAKAGLGQAQAAIERALALVKRDEAALQEARSNLERRAGLRAKDPGWVSEEELTALRTAVSRLEASLEESKAGEAQARAALEASKASLALAKKNRADSLVQSPIAGTIEAKRVAAGQYVKVGDKIATLVDRRRLRLRFSVSESESVKLQNGQEFRFAVRAFPTQAFRARVFHMSGTADPRTRMVECLGEVVETDLRLKPGFFATVTIEISKSGEAVVVPVEAVLSTERGFAAFVAVDGKAQRRDLKLGLHTPDGGVEVLSGLAAGETLVVRGADVLQEGAALKFASEDGATKKQ